MTKLASLSVVLVALLANVSMGQSKLVPVLKGLDNPCGVAIQPGTQDVFVAESGASRIIRVVDGKAENVIVDFPTDVYGKGPKINIGPLGLLFLDKDTLVVGGGGYKDGEELLRVYKVPAKGEAAIKADKMVSSFNLAAKDELKGEGNFYALTRVGNAIYVTANGDDTKGWVGRAMISGTKVTGFERYLATKEATELDAPVAITTGPYGNLVVGQMGEVTVPKDGMVTYYDAKNKKMLANFEVPLSDITGLAYSPKGQLYATDFAWPYQKEDPPEGGLYQLIAKRKDGKQTVTVNKIVGLKRPTALAFNKQGACYITICGEKENEKTGQLLMIASGL